MKLVSFNGAATFRSRNPNTPKLGNGSVWSLQWSRDLSIAESRGYGPRDRVPRRFNGAATFRSRNHARHHRDGAQDLRFNGAATFRSRNRIGGQRWSNGMGLQWSRDLSIAESPPPHRPCWPATCFNGAATFRSRNPRVTDGTGRRSSCFNGAATFRSRNGPIRRGGWPRWRCFNGAATFRSRNRLERILRTGEIEYSFNGALTFRSRNRHHPRSCPSPPHASMEPRPFDRGIRS